MAGWSSGWVAAAGSNTDTSFSHNLNSTDVIWQIYVADNMEGLNASIIDMQLDLLANTTDTLGAMMTNVTDTSFSLSLGVGYVDKAHDHQEISFDGKFVKVVGFAATTNSVPGTGDLCSLLSADSGYQMFRNGLTIQWMSSEALIAENALPIDFPIPFSVKPFKVVASTRFPEGDSSSQQWIQVVNSTKDNVTVYCQSQNVGSWTKPIYADIIAIGIAEVVNCPNSEGSAGTKISNLKKATSLKDSDLFVISKEIDGDGNYDTSNSVKLSDIAQHVTPPEKTILKVEQSFAQYTLGHTDAGGWKGGDAAYTLVTNMSTGETFSSNFSAGYDHACAYGAHHSDDGWSQAIEKSELTTCSLNAAIDQAITDLAPILTEEQVRDLFNRPDFSEIFLFI
jgi:hypothetical protein